MARESDAVTIGTRPRDYTTAFKAAEFGLKAVVIEAREVGGTYVDGGYIPTRALLHASDILHMMQSYGEFGVSADFTSFDFGEIQKYKKSTVIKYRDGIEYGSEKLNVEVVYGTAVLRGDKTVEMELKESDREFFRGSIVIIATGAAPCMNRILGTNLTGVWNSDGLLTAESWNLGRLIIMGGGIIAVKFATMFNNLYSHVTIVEKQKRPVALMGDMMPAELEKELHQKGIDVYCGATITEILEDEDGPSCVTAPNGEGEPAKIGTGQILMAIGHRPNVEKLLGKDTSPEMEGGKIVVDSDFETSEREIYTIGDVFARTQLAHVAATQGTYVVEKIAERPYSTKLEVVPNGMYVSSPIVPNCIHTDPEVATVGVAGGTAREKGLRIRYGHFSTREDGESIITGGENGFTHLVFEAYSSTIVGAQMMRPRVADIIGEIAAAIANGLSAEKMSFAMRAQPTYNEGIGVAIGDTMRKK